MSLEFSSRKWGYAGAVALQAEFFAMLEAWLEGSGRFAGGGSKNFAEPGGRERIFWQQ